VELDTEYANFFTATPFPGTPFYDYAQLHGLFGDAPPNFSNAYYFPAAKGHHLSREEIFALHRDAVRRFFLRPGYILKTLARVRSWRELGNFAAAGLALLRR
jgi:hypothetical protein